jgi:hypothetical protein
MTPFGPEAMDKFISRVLGLKGDFITDFRLIDYLVCLMSTDQSPALDGQPGNDIRLINDLSDLGVFDPSIALYLLYRLRDFGTMGFSGFEGRHYSQFASLEVDMAEATNLQCLITALAFKYILKRKVNHTLIPNDPFVESERRQIFFGSAIGLPTFYVKKNTPNQFLAGILKKTKNIRSSRRYPGYFRILNIEYCKALLEILKTEASDLIEMMDMHHTTEDLEKRIEDPDAYSAGSRLTSGILNHANMSTPLKLSGHDFNCAAERYYRDALRIDYMKEAFDFLKEDFKKIDSWKSWREGYYNQALLDILGGKSAVDFLLNIKDDIIKENASADNLRKLIHVTILTIHQDIEKAGA